MLLRVISFVLCLAFVPVSLLAAEPTVLIDNKTRNGSFESGTNGWGIYHAGSRDVVDAAAQGGRALRLGGEAETGQIRPRLQSQNIRLSGEPVGSFAVAWSVRGDDADPVAQTLATFIFLDEQNQPVHVVPSSATTVPQGEWQRYVHETTYPEDKPAPAAVSLRIELVKATENRATRAAGFVDDVMLVRGDAETVRRWVASAGGQQPQPRQNASARPKGPPIPVTFELPAPGYVTLVIDDARGRRVRNLVAETFFEAGKHTVYWDGLDEGTDVYVPGTSATYRIRQSLVEPGEYVVRGLYRAELALRYEFSVYPSHGSPPWTTGLQRGKGGWLADHNPPSDVLFIDGDKAPGGVPQIIAVARVAEQGHGVIWVKTDGTKLDGRRHIGGNWTGATHLARDTGSEAIDEHYAYSAIVWRDDNNRDATEIRLLALIDDGINSVATLPLEGTRPENDVTGLAAHNGLILLAVRRTPEGAEPINTVIAVDAKTGRELRRVNAPGVRDFAFLDADRLLVAEATGLAEYALVRGAEPELRRDRVVVSSHLQDAQRLLLGQGNEVYISDWGDSHQVKVFDRSTGALLRTIGDTGPFTGPYNPRRMYKPYGMTLTDEGVLWVAERTNVPKRISLWLTDGTFERAFYGPAEYGGGGALTSDGSTLYYGGKDGGLAFDLDWDAGTSRLSHVYWDETDTPFFTTNWKGPQTPVTLPSGRRLISSAYSGQPTHGTGMLTFWQFDDRKVAHPAIWITGAAHWGFVTENGLVPDDNRVRNATLVTWTDPNGSGEIRPQDVQTRDLSDLGVRYLMGILHDSDMTLWIVHKHGVLRLPPSGETSQGLPIYDPADAEVAYTTDVRPTSGGGELLAFEDGHRVLTSGPIRGFKGDHLQWLYHTQWPSLHDGHAAPNRPSYPGQLLATTRTLGPPFTPTDGEAGPVWAINSDKGVFYLFTSDGLFIDTVGAYPGGASWNMPEAERGMRLDDVNFISEHFFPTLQQLDDGRVILVGGKNHLSIATLDGLQTVRRIEAQPLEVGPEELLAARDYQVVVEEKRARESNPQPLTLRRGSTPPDWSDANWLPLGVRDPVGRRDVPPEAHAAVAMDATHLYVAIRSSRKDVAEAQPTRIEELFAAGGGIDVMLRTTPLTGDGSTDVKAGDLRWLSATVGDDVVSAIFRQVDPNASSPGVVFESPVARVEIDSITDVSRKVRVARKTADGQALVEAAIPLETLGWKPVQGQTYLFDVGLLIGDGRVTVDRVYWHNHVTGLTADVPAQAVLSPSLWGKLRVE